MKIADCPVEDIKDELFYKRVKDASKWEFEVQFKDNLKKILRLHLIPKFEIGHSDQIVNDLIKISYFILTQFTSTSFSLKTLRLSFSSFDNIVSITPKFYRKAFIKSDSSNWALSYR